MPQLDKDKRKEYNKKQYNLNKLKNNSVAITQPIIEKIEQPIIELADLNLGLSPQTIEIQIINKYKDCLLLQLTHNNFMIWLTLNNLVNIELIELYEPYLFKKEWNFRMKSCLKSVIEWAK